MCKEPDEKIIERILGGEVENFRVLVERYTPKVAAVAYGYLGPYGDVEDAVQETFFRAYKQLPTLSSYRQFGSWIVRIARNLCIDILRRRREGQSLDGIEEKGIFFVSEEKTPIAKILESEEVEKFHKAFGLLEPEYRELLILKEFLGLSYREISEIVGLTEAKIGEKLYRARRQLRRKLQDLQYNSNE